MQLLNLRPINKGCVVASFDVKMPQWRNFIIRKCLLFQKGNRRWITLPSEKTETAEGTKFYPLNRFEEREDQDAFSRKVIELYDQAEKPEEPPGVDEDLDSDLPF